MLIRASVFLISCLLVAVIGCATNSAVTQQSNSSQPSPSPPQPTPPAQASATGGAAEQQQNAKTDTAAPGVQRDACSMITKSEIEAVQGEPVKDTKGSTRAVGSLDISRCFYTLASFNKSVSLEVTRINTADAGKSGPKEFWNNTFHKQVDKEEREEEGDREEEEKEASKPRPVPGVGDEAYWSGNRTTGALYVLKNNAFIRISIGGPDNESVKIDKTKALAQKAIGRL